MKQAKYNAVDLAKYIVTKCTKEDCPISNLQLQKILYYIQREFLKNDIPAFSNRIEAWQFGPVVPEVYYEFCEFGSMAIDDTYTISIDMDKQHRKTIDKIVEDKRDLYPWDLVRDTHQKNGAWYKIYDNGNGNHKKIDNSLIKTLG